MILYLVLLLFGHALWWLIFGIECTMNGAMRGQFSRPYIYCWEDFQSFIGIRDKDPEEPGLVYWILMHICLPLFPAFAYYQLIEGMKWVF